MGIVSATIHSVRLSSIPYRPLGLVINLLEEAGLVYSYCYEDLVFVESSVVLFRMGERPSDVFLYRHVDCPDRDAEDLEIKLVLASKKDGLTLIPSGRYQLKIIRKSGGGHSVFGLN